MFFLSLIFYLNTLNYKLCDNQWLWLWPKLGYNIRRSDDSLT